MEQCAALSRAVHSAQLEQFYIGSCYFENDESFEQMLEGCTGVADLSVSCRNNSQCTALAAFFRDPANTLRYIHITLDRGVGEQAARNILASLAKNSHLIMLVLQSYGGIAVDFLTATNFCVMSQVYRVFPTQITRFRIFLYLDTSFRHW